MYDDVKILTPVMYFRLTLNIGNKGYKGMSMEILTLSHLGRARECFMTKSSSSQQAAPF